MTLDTFLFHPGASWPTRPYWAARNQRREGNHLPLMPPNYGITQSWGLNPCPSLVPGARVQVLWTIHRAVNCVPNTSFSASSHLLFVSSQGSPGEPGLDVSSSPSTVAGSLPRVTFALMLPIQKLDLDGLDVSPFPMAGTTTHWFHPCPQCQIQHIAQSRCLLDGWMGG